MNKRKRDISDHTTSSSITSISSDIYHNKNIVKPISQLSSLLTSSTTTTSAHSPPTLPLQSGYLFPSGDLFLFSFENSFTIHLYKEILTYSNPICSYFQTNSNEYSRTNSYYITSYIDSLHHHQHYILATPTGHILFALTAAGNDERISKIEYQIQFNDENDINEDNPHITTMCYADNLAIFGTRNNEIYLVGRDYTNSRVSVENFQTSMRIFCYKLRKPRNLLIDWLETGTKLLGFGWNMNAKYTSSPYLDANFILKLVPFHLQTSSSLTTSLLCSLNSTSLTLWELFQYPHLLTNPLEQTSTGTTTSPTSTTTTTTIPIHIDEEGKEKMYWEINLQLLLEHDMNSQLSSVITNQIGGAKFASMSHSNNNNKIHRKFQFLDLMSLTSPQEYYPDTDSSPRKCINLLLLSIVYPRHGGGGGGEIPSNSYLLHPELWIHILQIDVTDPTSQSNSDLHEINLSSNIVLQQSVCQMKLRRRLAVLHPSMKVSSEFKPRLLAGSRSDSIIVTWYDCPRSSSDDLRDNGHTPTPSLHSVELIDLYRFTTSSQEKNTSEIPSNDIWNSPSNTDSTAYSDYFLLHDTVGTSPRGTKAKDYLQKSNLCEGIGADTGILVNSVKSFEAIQLQHQGETTMVRKGLTILTAGCDSFFLCLSYPIDGSILSCTSPEVSVVALYTTAPASPIPSTDIMKILLSRCYAEVKHLSCLF